MLCHVFWSQIEYKIVCFISSESLVSSRSSTDPNLVLFLVSSFDLDGKLEEILRLSKLCVRPSTSSSSSGDPKLSCLKIIFFIWYFSSSLSLVISHSVYTQGGYLTKC